MAVYNKYRIGLVWSLILTVLIVIPKYWELKIESIPPLAPPPVDIPKTQVVEDKIQKNRTLVATLVDYDVPVAIASGIPMNASAAGAQKMCTATSALNAPRITPPRTSQLRHCGRVRIM